MIFSADAESEAATDDDDDNSITIIFSVGAAVALVGVIGLVYVIRKQRARNRPTNTAPQHRESRQSQYGDSQQNYEYYGGSQLSQYGASRASTKGHQSNVSRASDVSYASTYV